MLIKNNEALKSNLPIEDVKIETVSKIIDHCELIENTQIHKSKRKVRTVKNRVPVKRSSRLERATQRLYDLEECTEAEKILNIDFGLYQMEDY